jgi:phosphoserine phosphatase
MSAEHVLICVSDNEFPEIFKKDLNKSFNSLQFKIVISEEKKNTYSFFSMAMVSGPTQSLNLLNAALMQLSVIYRIDIGLIPKNIFYAKKGLVIFDMDSTLITAEVIDEMASVHGVGEKVKLITAKAMNGELNFDQSLTERVSLLKGFHRGHMEKIMRGLQFTPGTPQFLQILRSLGVKTAIASGGFQYFAKNIQAQLNMDYVFANELEFLGDELTGNIKGPIINAQTKEKIVLDLAQKEGLGLEQVVAIGDGANDIPMLLKAGLGIAIHAKEKVQKSAHYRINFGPMTHALSFMNI